jgi:succinate dehydrogenase / fumarate reductase, iron-sulfur subunit
MKLTLHVWRQDSARDAGRFEKYEATDVSEHMSFLEMLDVVNERLTVEGKEPIAFDHDCREGICGSCGMMINGVPHGPSARLTTACQLHMRSFKDGETRCGSSRGARPRSRSSATWWWTAAASTASSRRAATSRSGPGARRTETPSRFPKDDADAAFDAATCIGCGACVAACPNASAMLFTAAKVAHLASVPQGQPERWDRVISMVDQHDDEGFGNCTNHGACQVACPKGISIDYIAQLNRDLVRATLKAKPVESGKDA